MRSVRKPLQAMPPALALALPLALLLAFGARSSAGEAALEAPSADAALVELRDDLARLLAGELPEGVPVASLFGVTLDDPSARRDRIAELEGQTAESEDRIAAMQERQRQLAAEAAADALVLEPPAAEREVVGDDPASPPAEGTEPAEGAEPDEGAEAEARERQRQEALAAQRARAEARAQERSEIEAEIAATSLGHEVAKLRLEYVAELDDRLDHMTDASRRILPSLGEPREGLRGHAELVASLGASVEALAARSEILGERSRSGMLVGFVSEQRSLAVDFPAAAESYRAQAARLAAQSDALLRLATSVEREGERVRAAIFRSVVRQGAASNGENGAIDQFFLTHLKTQRRLRKSVSNLLAAPDRDALEASRKATAGLAPTPRHIRTTTDARRVAETGVEHRQEIDSLLAGELAAMTGWQLAFENEIVTVLSEQASSGARTNAYELSSEVVDDVAAELEVAWGRLNRGIDERRAEVPTLAALVGSARGQGYLARTAGVLGVLGAWFFLRRQAPRIAVLAVRTLARVPRLKRRVGLLVRGGGLLQAVLPPLLGLGALQIALSIVGRASPGGQTLRAIALPLLVYQLGRQLLVGATQRITRGRPALIALAPATLERLQRTYATLGLFIAGAYILDEVARVAIGAGILVRLLDGVVLAWVGIWSVFEAYRWRLPLARSWAGLAPEAEPARLEQRAAEWMGAHRLGFALSPIALARVVGTPIARWFSELARETNLVQSLRARLLRRRSALAEGATQSEKKPLPETYLEAFPLYPILGEDDSLLVQRESVLVEAVEQLERWRGSRAESSLVLIGEKGAGKTTLAAQIARRASDLAVTLHTIAGKPTTREALVATLAEALSCPGARDLEGLATSLCDGTDRVVLLDETHNLFLRRVDGYGAYDALVELVNATSSKVFWVLVFNEFTWRFLSESRGRVHYFRRLLQVPKWTTAEIQELVRVRHKRTGFDLHFDELLLSDDRSGSGGLELVEEAEGYFRLLWESSGGNPRIATQLWLSSLSPSSENVLRVGVFREPSTAVLDELQDELLFCLAAICQHENLGADEMTRVLNVSEGFGRFAIPFLSESGFIEPKDESGERYTLAPAYYRAVLRELRSKHLLLD